jgi:hypothetical protein
MTPDEAWVIAERIYNDHIDAGGLLGASAVALIEAAGQWNADMDAAPRDKQILACSPDHKGPLILRWFKYNGLAAWRDWDNDAHQPTHWRHLPAPPEADA